MGSTPGGNRNDPRHWDSPRTLRSRSAHGSWRHRRSISRPRYAAEPQLNQSHICTLYDVGPNYPVMELAEATTLSPRIASGAPMAAALRFGAQIAEALAAAHKKGIVDRDLKPSNILLAKAGVKVPDFGLANTQDDETLTAVDAVMGTPVYIATGVRDRQEGTREFRSTILSHLSVANFRHFGWRTAHPTRPSHRTDWSAAARRRGSAATRSRDPLGRIGGVRPRQDGQAVPSNLRKTQTPQKHYPLSQTVWISNWRN